MRNDMKKVAQMIECELDNEILRAEQKHIEVPEDYHQNMISFIRGLEQEEATVRVDIKKGQRKRCLRAASIVLIAFIGFNTMAITVSAAYRQRVFSLFNTEDGKAVTLRTEDKYKLLEGWNAYWYPTEIPQGYQLTEANRQNKTDFLWFKSNKSSNSIRIVMMPDNYEPTYDLEFLTWDELNIDMYDGYYMVDERYNTHYGVCLMENYICEVQWEGECEKEDIEKLIASLEYIR